VHGKNILSGNFRAKRVKDVKTPDSLTYQHKEGFPECQKEPLPDLGYLVLW
jgi:hypothetical protein